MESLLKKGVRCERPVFRPIHHYLNRPALKVSEAAWCRSLSIPIYPSLNANEVNRIIAAVREVFREKFSK
jgi:dTDP-4-amino-4,6-dideoxygalactose transaminase